VSHVKDEIFDLLRWRDAAIEAKDLKTRCAISEVLESAMEARGEDWGRAEAEQARLERERRRTKKARDGRAENRGNREREAAAARLLKNEPDIKDVEILNELERRGFGRGRNGWLKLFRLDRQIEAERRTNEVAGRVVNRLGDKR
jgi:hypothetical protein